MAPPKTDNWVRRYVVSDPRTHKKGFTIYKVTSIVSINKFDAYYNNFNLLFKNYFDITSTSVASVHNVH